MRLIRIYIIIIIIIIIIKVSSCHIFVVVVAVFLPEMCLFQGRDNSFWLMTYF